MTGTIKIVGANNATCPEWMGKQYENCKIEFDTQQNAHILEVPERGDVHVEIYRSWIMEDCFVFEGYAHIEDTLGRLAIEFYPK